jgi:hypothetical protein
MGRLIDEPDMGGLLLAGLWITSMASVTGKVMMLIQGHGVTAQAANNHLRFDSSLARDTLVRGVTL